MQIKQSTVNEITVFIAAALPVWKQELTEYKIDYMDLTFAVDDAGELWNFQTGDNSFTGGAYSLPHWAVISISPESTSDDVTCEIINQFANIEVFT